MKLLWVKTDFLHPTTRGSQIRTLELLRCLHRRHEIHYIAFNDPNEPEGLERAKEYSSKTYPIDYQPVDKRSPAFLIELIVGLFSKIPVTIQRCRSTQMRAQIERLMQQEHFDCIVCDFLSPSPNLHPGVHVTGTVPDVGLWLWGSNVFIVPLRVGGGTRLKIFEAMAAGIAVVSTTIGAEELGSRDGETIRIADTRACIALLDSAVKRQRLRGRALQMVTEQYSWEAVGGAFEKLLVA